MLHGPGVPPGVQVGDAVGVAVGGTVGVGLAQPPPVTLISTDVVVFGTGVAAHRYRCVAHMRPCWECALLDQSRPAAPHVGTWVIHLQRVCGIRVEQPVEPRS